MTKEQVAELLLKMNDDLSNVVFENENIRLKKPPTLEAILKDIANGWVFEIKDNSVKEITLDLLGKTVISKEKKAKGIISFVFLGDEYTNAYLHIRNEAYNLISFNKVWQLVED